MAFDPDKYLAQKQAAPPIAFDPDAYLKATSSGIPAPRKTGTVVDQIPGYGGPVPASTAAPERPESGFFGKLISPLETAVTLGTSAITAPIVEGAKIYGALTSGQFGTQQGIKVGEETGRKVQQFFQPQVSPESERQTAAISNALASTGLQGVPLNMLGNMATLAGPAVQQVAPVVKAPIEARQRRVQEARVAQSYKDAPRIEAAEAGQRLGVALNPAESNPTLGNKITSVVGGTTDIDSRLSKFNIPQITDKVRQDLGVAATEKLDDAAINRALDRASAPYDPIRAIPVLNASDNVIASIKALDKPATLGGKSQASAVTALIGDAVAELQAGRSGAQIIDDIRQLRKGAQSVYKARDKGNNPAPADVLKADAQMGIANALEKMIDENAPNPRALSEFQQARQRMAQIYDHERALDYGTGTIDPMSYAKMLNERKGNMTGVGADIGKVAANFPKVLGTDLAADLKPRLTRSGLGGTLGFIVGGVPGAALGAGTGYLASAAQAKRMMSPAYQRANAIPKDYRPTPSGLRPVEPNAPVNALTPYQPEVVGPSGARPAPALRIVSYDQDGNPIFAPNPEDLTAARGQGFTMPPEPTFGNRPTVFESQRGLPNEMPQQKARQLYEAQQRADLAQGFREADERMPAGRGVELMFDNAGNLVSVPTSGAGGVMPSALESAVAKMSGQMVFEPRTQYETVQTGSYLNRAPMTETRALEQLTLTPAEAKKYALPTRQGQAFAMTAEEKIAWNKAKADLAEVVPGMKTLDDKAIASKMMDREWVQQAIVKAKQKAKLQDQILARSNDEKARRLAQIERDKLEGTLELLEEQFRKARPVKTGDQGPKTRAFQRNKLNMLSDQEVMNRLLEK